MTTSFLTPRILRDVNVRRCEAVFHPLNAWSARQWACCVFGESGELVGELKKLWWRNDGSVAAVAGEAADVLIYLDLLGAVSGYSLLDESSSTIASEAADVINAVSDRRGCEIKLAPGVTA